MRAKICLIIMIILFLSTHMGIAFSDDRAYVPLRDIEKFILEKVKKNQTFFEDKFPTATKDGKYKLGEDGGWVGGFWPGINFLCYEITKDNSFLEEARVSRYRLKDRLYHKTQSLDHDIGFLYTLSCVADYKITGDRDARKIALDAADILAKRYHEKGEFIQAWDVWRGNEQFSEENKGRMIIDCMYNLPILFWASEETGNAKYREIAVKHADTCGKYLVRPDYTTYHSYVFDADTGKPKYGRTVQGYSDDSCWARGQAWAIGGYTYAYDYTHNPKYLNIARNCAKVFVASLEDDDIPMWDLALKGYKGEPRDASAAAIAASGMLQLSRDVPDDEKDFYMQTAGKILKSLYENYSTKSLPNEQGLILHACGNRPAYTDIDCSLIYGDYFFIEAMVRMEGFSVKYW